MVPVPEMIVGGKFRLERPLAKGGMGSVWLGRHTELDSPVAVKFMAPELAGTPVARTRFKREAKAAAQLRSPNVVSIQDYGVEDDTPYMVMELLEGEDLHDLLEREKRLSIPRIAGIVAQVAKALGMAHAAGIVHRDLKPSNLFLARSGDDEIVKVLDFGVAKEMGTLAADKTTSGVLVGSPMYMSPEQARGEAIDFRSDLWSLGVVVYEALAGRPPFVSDHLGALLARIHEARAERPTSIAPDLPGEVDAFVARALARQPEARFASAKEMADALAAIAEAHPASTAPVDRGAAVARTGVRVDGGSSIADRDTELPEAPGALRGEASGESGAPSPKGVGREEHTISAVEPNPETSPVSTTMAERVDPGGNAGSTRSRVVLVSAGVAALAAVIAIGWIGFGGAGSGAAENGGTTSIGTAHEGAATTSSGAAHGATAIEVTTSTVEPAPRANDAPSAIGTTSASARAVPSSRPSGTARPAAPTATATAAGSTAPVTTGAPGPAVTAPDPTFGVLPGKR